MQSYRSQLAAVILIVLKLYSQLIDNQYVYQILLLSDQYFLQQAIQRNIQAKAIVTSLCKPKPTKNPAEIQNSISCLAWNANATDKIPFLAAADWLGQLKLYRLVLENNLNIRAQLKASRKNNEVSVLKCCWSTSNNVLCYFGDSAGTISSYDMGKQLQQKGRQHQKAISSLQYLSQYNLLASTAYSAECKLWDSRQQICAMSLELPGKILCSAHNNNYLAFALSNYNLAVLDFRTAPKYQITPSPLGEYSQIQSLAVHPLLNIVGVGSFDGRLAVCPLEQQSEIGGWVVCVEKGSILNAHFCETKNPKGQSVSIQYPINSIGFSPSNPHWVYSAGSRRLIFLDYQRKMRVRSYEKGGPFTAVAVTDDGGCMAYSNGNDWHTGKNEDWETEITIRLLTEKDYFAYD